MLSSLRAAVQELSPFLDVAAGLHRVDFETSTGWELEVRSSSFQTLRLPKNWALMEISMPTSMQISVEQDKKN